MDAKKTGKIIQQCREQIGLSQKELANALSLSPKTISKWECGRGLPDIGILLELSRILNISPTELLTGELTSSDTILKSDADMAISNLVWKTYGKKQRLKKFFTIFLLTVIFIGSLSGFIITLQNDNFYFYIIWGCICLITGITISIRLMGPRIRDWTKQPAVTTEATVLEKKIRISGGGSATGYPCIIIRTYGDERKTLDTADWDVYDSLFPGDRIRVTYQGFVLKDYTLLQQGPVSKEAAEIHSKQAQFIKKYVKTVARWHHFPVADFVLENGRKLTLRVEADWEPPVRNSSGILKWHGEYMDSFQYSEQGSHN